jgi:chromosome segregation ATPase
MNITKRFKSLRKEIDDLSNEVALALGAAADAQYQLTRDGVRTALNRAKLPTIRTLVREIHEQVGYIYSTLQPGKGLAKGQLERIEAQLDGRDEYIRDSLRARVEGVQHQLTELTKAAKAGDQRLQRLLGEGYELQGPTDHQLDTLQTQLDTLELTLRPVMNTCVWLESQLRENGSIKALWDARTTDLHTKLDRLLAAHDRGPQQVNAGPWVLVSRLNTLQERVASIIEHQDKQTQAIATLARELELHRGKTE